MKIDTPEVLSGGVHSNGPMMMLLPEAMGPAAGSIGVASGANSLGQTALTPRGPLNALTVAPEADAVPRLRTRTYR